MRVAVAEQKPITVRSMLPAVLWAANYPEQVPLVKDEFEWIALAMADLD